MQSVDCTQTLQLLYFTGGPKPCLGIKAELQWLSLSPIRVDHLPSWNLNMIGQIFTLEVIPRPDEPALSVANAVTVREECLED